MRWEGQELNLEICLIHLAARRRTLTSLQRVRIPIINHSHCQPYQKNIALLAKNANKNTYHIWNVYLPRIPVLISFHLHNGPMDRYYYFHGRNWVSERLNNLPKVGGGARIQSVPWFSFLAKHKKMEISRPPISHQLRTP